VPSDYDEWRQHGVVGWSWAEVAPYFNELEHDEDFAGPLHGKRGPVHLQRIRPDGWAPFNMAVTEALRRRGYPLIEDFNSDFRDGVSALPMNCLPTRRVSASMAYLPQKIRQRRNLTILPHSIAQRLEAREGRVHGVEVRSAAGAHLYEAHETLIACGALQSPAVLMRSGIGPAPYLHSLGIRVVRDLPGVGRNLQNHPMIGFVTHLTRSSRQPPAQRRWLQCVLRYSSRHEGCADHDMVAIPLNKVAWHPLGECVGGILVEVHKSFSQGWVELASCDPAVPPRVHFNLLADERDLERLVAGARLALDVLGDTAVAAARHEVFFPNPKIIARLTQRTRWSYLQAWAIARLFDSTFLRSRLLGSAKLDVSAFARDEQALRRFVRQAAQPVYHPCGTCRMGDTPGAGAVLDSDCRVLGVEGLRVVDASVFPTIPSGSLHLPVLMTAEKIAARIKQGWGSVA
jgi:5-(hydroxymethyl)furfural/furfural oxidase